MGLFLPVLLISLVHPIEQSAASLAVSRAVVQADANAKVSHDPYSTLEWRRGFSTIDGDTDSDRNLCYTMRSYFFQRSDDLAPELVGVTTCSPAGSRTLKRVNRTPRLIPAK